jgi:hypothetical protein
MWANDGARKKLGQCLGEEHEYLDHFVRNFADCMDYRLLGLSRGRRVNPSTVDFRGDFPDLTFRHGTQRGLKKRGV